MFIKIAFASLVAVLGTATPAFAPMNYVQDDSATYVGQTDITPDFAKAYVKHQANLAGYTNQQWQCLNELVYRESRWLWQADNAYTTAFGLFQIIDLDPDASLATQTKRGFKYITHRYGTPCVALAFHNKNGWY